MAGRLSPRPLRRVVHIDRIVGDNAIVCGQTWIGRELAAGIGSVIAVTRQPEASGGFATNDQQFRRRNDRHHP